MLSQVCDYMKLNTMLERGDRIVVGVSGGADSVCLLYVLNELKEKLGITLIVVHINHSIRGEDALRDQLYVEELSEKLGLIHYSFKKEVRKLAKKEGLSEEEAGRKARYDTFLEVCKLHKCNKIAIAHNKNDNAETVLFHLFRGSGIKGLSGIDAVRVIQTENGGITLIRPLLCVSRQEIEDYLRLKEITYCTDQTNFSNDYSRNKIRNLILPVAADEINRNTVQHITEAADQLKCIERYLDQLTIQRFQDLVSEKDHRLIISAEKLKNEDIIIQRGIVRKIFEYLTGKLKDIEAKHIEQVLDLCGKQVGKQVHLPYGMVAVREYNDISIYLMAEASNPDDRQSDISISLLVPGRIFLPDINKIIETEIIPRNENITIPKNSCIKWFDYDKIENAVVIRYRNEGDYIQINRSGGNKKLKDYFIDRKIPKEERDRCMLVADGSHIMWLIGYGDRISEKYKVEDETKRILLMKLIDGGNQNGRQ